MITPILFIGIVLIISSNYKLNIKLVETNSLKHFTILEESKYMIPFVLQKYYMNVIDVTSYLFPSLLSTSFWHENTELKKEKEIIIRNEYIINILKKIGLFLSIVLFSLILYSWYKYNPNKIDYQLLTDIDSKDIIWCYNIKLGLDGLSLPFLSLVGFIMPIVYLSNWSSIDKLDVYYILIIILLELFLITVFLVIDLIMFYIFFESILPPLFVLIGLYGASQKFRAGYYLFLYTLFGSLFMLVSFVKMGSDTATTFFEGYGNKNTYELLQEIMWIVLFVSFSVKTPLVPVHIWLPLAHSDANVSGSIILASIVLKLALYGFIRILIGIFALSTVKLIPFFFGLCSLSVLYSSFTTVRQFDLKVLVAYSSIAHMASSLLGTFSNTLYGLVGSIIFGLAHGFVSPGLFILVGAVLYDRCGSRIINYYRGLTNLLPFFALLFLVFVFGNMGVPLTGNFIGEFLSLLGAYQQNIFIASIGVTSVILSAVYSIFMYNRVTGGSLSPYIHTIPDIFRKEFYIILPLLILTLILGIYPSFITYEIEFGLSNYLLFTFFPPIFIRKRDLSEADVEFLHMVVSNPHNTPVVNRELPPTSENNSNNINNNNNEEETVESDSDESESDSENSEEESNIIGNDASEEGHSRYVGIDDEENQPVDSVELHNRILNVGAQDILDELSVMYPSDEESNNEEMDDNSSEASLESSRSEETNSTLPEPEPEPESKPEQSESEEIIISSGRSSSASDNGGELTEQNSVNINISKSIYVDAYSDKDIVYDLPNDNLEFSLIYADNFFKECNMPHSYSYNISIDENILANEKDNEEGENSANEEKEGENNNEGENDGSKWQGGNKDNGRGSNGNDGQNDDDNNDDEDGKNSDSSSSTIRPSSNNGSDSEGYDGDIEIDDSWLIDDSDSDEDESKSETENNQPNSTHSKPVQGEPDHSKPDQGESVPYEPISNKAVPGQSNPNDPDPIISQSIPVIGNRPTTKPGDSDGDQCPTPKSRPPQGRASDDEYAWMRGSKHKEWWADPSNPNFEDHEDIIIINLEETEEKKETSEPIEFYFFDYEYEHLDLIPFLGWLDSFLCHIIFPNFWGFLALMYFFSKQYSFYLKIKQLYNEYPVLLSFKINLYWSKLKEKIWKK